jgi:hypothetical protein
VRRAVMKRISFVIVIAAVLAANGALGQVPQTISYQGVLKDDMGAIVPEDDYDFEFNIYDVPSGGTPLWTENQTKHVTVGILNVVLGEVIPITLPFDEQYWLGVTIGAGDEFSPRTKLTGAPYALNAQAVLGTHNEFPDSGFIGIGTTDPDYPLHIVSDELRGLRIDGTRPGSWSLLSINASGSALSPGIEFLRGDDYKARTNLDSNDDWHFVMGTTDVLTFDSATNNVGVGITDPVEKLDVGGGVKLGSTVSTNAGTIRWTGSDFEGNDGSTWQSFTAGGPGGELPFGSLGQTLRHNGSNWVATDFLYNDGDRIGIGTTSPSAELEIIGDNMTNHFKLTAATGAGPSLYFNALNKDWTIYGSNPGSSAGDRKLVFRDFSSAEDRMVIDENGHVGIGEKYPDATLHVAGGNFYLDSSEGDLKIGDDNYSLKIGVSTIGDSTGYHRIYADGGYGRILIGGGWAENIMTLYPSVSPGYTGYVDIGNLNQTGELSVWRDGLNWAGITLKSNDYGGSFVLYDDQGAGAAWLRADDDGTGVIFELDRGYLKNGFSYYGNVAGSELPIVYISGEGRWITFDMTVTGDSCVSLPPDVIASHETLDEPGTASLSGSLSSVFLDGSVQTLLYRSIVVPANGYVQVIATAQAILTHVKGISSTADFGVSDTSISFPANQDVALQIPDSAASGHYSFPVTVHGLFEVSAGTHTFYFLAQEYSGDIAAYDLQLTLIYIPTAYGTVVSTLTGPRGVPDADAPKMTSVMDADVVAERYESERLNRERIDRELNKLHKEIERLKVILARESKRPESHERARR